MAKIFMVEDTYQQKLKNTINLRLFAFFFWKFIVMATLSYLFNYILSFEIINWINWKYYSGFYPSEFLMGKNFFIKIYIISIIIDWLRIIYYKKYEESFSRSDYFFKLFFLPDYNTIFFFLHFTLTTIFLALIEYTFHSKKFSDQKIEISR
jgi:hypothetical protein